MTINLNPVRILKFLISTIVVLAALNLAGVYIQYFTDYEEVKEHLVRLFYFDDEQNIPTFFSSLILLFSTLLISFIIVLEKRRGKYIRYWIGLALIFGFLSLDEAVSLHETFIGPVRILLHTDGVLYFAWVIPYGIITLLIAFFYIRFLFGLSYRVRMLMIISGCIFIFGAVILEMIGGNYYATSSGYQRDYTFSIIATIEEICEMCGVSLFIYSLLVYIKTECGSQTLKFQIEEKEKEYQTR